MTNRTILPFVVALIVTAAAVAYLVINRLWSLLGMFALGWSISAITWYTLLVRGEGEM